MKVTKPTVVLVVVGSCAISAGAWLLAPAAGLIVFGVIALAAGLGLLEVGGRR